MVSQHAVFNDMAFTWVEKILVFYEWTAKTIFTPIPNHFTDYLLSSLTILLALLLCWPKARLYKGYSIANKYFPICKYLFNFWCFQHMLPKSRINSGASLLHLRILQLTNTTFNYRPAAHNIFLRLWASTFTCLLIRLNNRPREHLFNDLFFEQC